ncbi:MAG: UvrD-helicase domain-containing protein, partial [Fervidobacterium sp.]
MEKSVAETVRENPNCNYFISASAGTGKTYTLTSYYIGILEYYEKYNDPEIVDKILAVTFTNKAANEMKERIMESVAKKFNTFSPSQREYHYWRRVYSNMSRALISTIDSFCRRVLVEQNIQVGVDPNFKIINELKQMKILENASRQAIEIAFKVYEDMDVTLSFTLVSERREKIEKYIEELKKNKESILHLFESVGNIEKVGKFVEEIVRNWRLELSQSRVNELLLNVLEKAGSSLQVLRLLS